jgi:hypothetical protein
VQMRVTRQIPAPGVQRHHHSRRRSQPLGIGGEFQQAAPRAVEQRPDEPAPVRLPQLQQAVGHGEDHMKVRARQQPSQLRIDPGLARIHAALGAGPVATRVVLQMLVVALFAVLQVRPQRCRVALANAPRRITLARVHIPTSRILFKAGYEDILQRTSIRLTLPAALCAPNTTAVGGLQA